MLPLSKIFIALLLSSSLVKANFQCPPGDIDGFHGDPYNCEVFYRCTNGQKFQFACGPGTVFNPSTNNCDWPGTSECSRRSNSPQTQPQGQASPYDRYGQGQSVQAPSGGIEPYGSAQSGQNQAYNPYAPQGGMSPVQTGGYDPNQAQPTDQYGYPYQGQTSIPERNVASSSGNPYGPGVVSNSHNQRGSYPDYGQSYPGSQSPRSPVNAQSKPPHQGTGRGYPEKSDEHDVAPLSEAPGGLNYPGHGGSGQRVKAQAKTDRTGYPSVNAGEYPPEYQGSPYQPDPNQVEGSSSGSRGGYPNQYQKPNRRPSEDPRKPGQGENPRSINRSSQQNRPGYDVDPERAAEAPETELDWRRGGPGKPGQDLRRDETQRNWRKPVAKNDSTIAWNGDTDPSKVTQDDLNQAYDDPSPAETQDPYRPDPWRQGNQEPEPNQGKPWENKRNRPIQNQSRYEPTEPRGSDASAARGSPYLNRASDRNQDPNQARSNGRPYPPNDARDRYGSSPYDRSSGQPGNHQRPDNRYSPRDEVQSRSDPRTSHRKPNYPQQPTRSDTIEPSPELAKDPRAKSGEQSTQDREQQPNDPWQRGQNRPDRYNDPNARNPRPNSRPTQQANQPYRRGQEKVNDDKNDDPNEWNQGKTNRAPERPSQIRYRPDPPRDRWAAPEAQDPQQSRSVPNQDFEPDSPEEDLASQTQWYRPKFPPPKSQETTPSPDYESHPGRPKNRDNRRDPNESESPYYNRRNEPRTNPSPRPVYRPDRRRGDLYPPQSRSQQQGRDDRGQPIQQQREEYPQSNRKPTPSRSDPYQDQAPDQGEEQSADLTFDSSEIEPRFPEETEMASAVNDIYEKDPYSVPDLMENLKCNETSLGEECEKCDKLKWLKFGKVTLKSQSEEAIRSTPQYIAKDCFRRCDRQGCVAYSYNEQQGSCSLYLGPVSVDDVQSDEDSVTVIKEPRSSLIADEWLFTENSVPIGKDMGSFTAEDSISCLRACVNVGDHCKAISFQAETKECKIYDAMNGERLALLGGGSSTLQHMSIHQRGDSWRFTRIGGRRLNETLPINSFTIREDQECFEECLNTEGCLFVSLEGRSPKECHIFNQLSELTDDEEYSSFILKVPKNSSQFLYLPGLYFSGKPIAKYERLELNDCQEAAKSTPGAQKMTHLKETGGCYIFSDSSKIGVWKNPEIEAKSFIVNLPDDWKYLAFKRLTGLTLSNALIARNGEKFPGERSASPCLASCLESNCSAVSVTYLDAEDAIECVLLKEDDMQKTPKFVFKEDAELFARILPGHLLPEATKSGSDQASDDHCSSRVNMPSADENLPYFEREKSKPPTLEEKLERYVQQVNPFNRNSNPNSNPWEDEDETMMLAPHGLEFEGMLDENPDPSEVGRKRNTRSVYGTTLRAAQVYHETMEQDERTSPLEAGAEAGFAVRELLGGSLGVSDNSTQDILLRRFLKRVSEQTQNPRVQDDLVQQMKTSARKVRSNDPGQNDERMPCKITRGASIKESKCRASEVCSEAPFVAHGDEQSLANCSATRINSSCTVTCMSGYKPSKDRIVCEQVGSSGAWNTKDVQCVNDDTICSELPWIAFKSSAGRINYLLKYDTERKLPLFAVYKPIGANSDPNSDKDETRGVNSNGDTEGNIVALPCPQLKNNQLSNLNYKLSNYTKGHLVPPSAFKGDKEAFDSVNYFVNTAPQDPYTKYGPWSMLENKIQAYLSKEPGFIVSGVCPGQIRLPSTSMLPVPKCFWKTVCTRTESGQVTTATFYHDNTIPEGPEGQKSRFEEVMSYTNQEFVATLIGQKEFDSIWPEVLDRFSTSKSKTVKDEMMILQCAGTKKINTDHIEFWNNLLTNGSALPEEFSADDLDTSESETSPRWARSVAANNVNGNCDKKVIAYIGLNGSQIKPESIGEPITHLTILSAVKIESNGSLNLGNDTKKIYDRLYELKALKNKKKELKILLALGGWSNSENFSKIGRSPKAQKTFILDVLAFLDYWNLDGVDIIWQYPSLGGKVKGSSDDKENLVRLVKNLKDSFVDHQMRSGREDPYSLVLTGPGLYWILDHGYDLKSLINHVDWMNIMAFDFHGPWNSSWGDYTGPHSPLYFGSPDGFPGKLNVDSIVKRYACETGRPDKLVLGLGFYGRVWTNVGKNVDETKDDLFRKASPLKNGKKGGLISYRKLKQDWFQRSEPKFHNQTRTSFIWDRMKRTLISFESEQSIREKVQYAADKGLGGLMIWSLDMDDEDGTLMKAISTGSDCPAADATQFKCNPLAGEKRHWTQYDEDGRKDRMCGKRAPLINGFYAVCDPDDPGYSCCSAAGFCGSGPDFCECEGCIDFGRDPQRVLNESVEPSVLVDWMTMDMIKDESKPNCGYNAEPLAGGKVPTCNPDDPKRHCCSSIGFCGTGPDFCECDGCVNFNTNSTTKFREKNWFDWSDGPENAGRCGSKAPRIKGQVAGCDPSSQQANCCGPNGYCGTGPDYCECRECVDFTKNPDFDWS